MAWVLAGGVCLFTIENVWIDPRAARRFHHRLPSLAPQFLSGTWLLVLLLLAFGLILALFCLMLLLRDSRLPMRTKAFTALLVLSAVALSAKWVVATGGSELHVWWQTQATVTKHSVTLRWNASTTPGARYNVYRGTAKGAHPDKLTREPIDGLSFTDHDVIRGKTYYYITRAVDRFGHESVDSNETSATIP